MASTSKKPSTKKERNTVVNGSTLKQKTLLDSFHRKTTQAFDTPSFVSSSTSESSALPAATNGTKPKDEIEQTNIPDGAITVIPETEPVIEILDDDSTTEPGVAGEYEREASIFIVDFQGPAVGVLPQIFIEEGVQGNQPFEGRSRERPIIISSSPAEHRRILPAHSTKHPHPFFRPKAKNLVTPPSPTKRPLFKPLDPLAPYPDSLSQHIKGSQTRPYLSGSPPLVRARRMPPNDRILQECASDYAFLNTPNDIPEIVHSLGVPKADETVDPRLAQVDSAHHPTIARMMTRTAEPTASHKQWIDKWRPARAEEVLGNELSATYLRNWLQALELQWEDADQPVGALGGREINKNVRPHKRGTKRPRIVRTVDKTRKKSRSGDDGWIVHSEESEEEVLDDIDFDLLDPCTPAQSLDAGRQPPLDFDHAGQALGQLHNTILLTGPCGSGKTASVYACAEELGWDIFEVYPGVGRRNGGSLDNLIGEVGKNHLVHQNHRTPSDALKTFIRGREQSETPVGKSEITEAPRPVLNPEPAQAPNAVRQSLILLEEVDILFKEDVNFWNSVTRIIKDCKRPVVCTCNDSSLVPVADLPLQNVLLFESCPAPVAVPYLQAMCSAEGYSINQSTVASLYRSPSLEVGPSNAVAAGPSTKLDLRRTIQDLQVLCPALSGVDIVPALDHLAISLSFTGPKLGPRLGMQQAETLSFMDSYLDPHLQELMISEFGSYTPSNDDEVGHSIMHDPSAKDRGHFGMYDRQREISAFGQQLGHGFFDTEIDSVVVEDLKLVVREVCPRWAWCRDWTAQCVDYIPAIRQVVAAEDMHEAEKERQGAGGRRTRNSARSEYVRTLELSTGGRVGLYRSQYS